MAGGLAADRPGGDGLGTLFYGDDQTALVFEDRVLAHLRAAMSVTLRQGQSFTVSWTHPSGQQPGRSTIWVSPSIPLRFVFDESHSITLNPAWVRQLAESANSSGGIQVLDEPAVVSRRR